MRRTGALLIALVLLVTGCTDDDPEPSAEDQAELFVYASERLPDELLQEAAPAGYEVERIVRHGPERTHSEWVTVGARMNGPVDFTRAIFYVHVDETSAARLNREQIRITKRDNERLHERPFHYSGRIPAPSEVSNGDVTATCGVRSDSLIWCHAQRDRLYLLVQSRAGTYPVSNKGPVTEEQLEAAGTVTAAYLELL